MYSICGMRPVASSNSSCKQLTHRIREPVEFIIFLLAYLPYSSPTYSQITGRKQFSSSPDSAHLYWWVSSGCLTKCPPSPCFPFFLPPNPNALWTTCFYFLATCPCQRVEKPRLPCYRYDQLQQCHRRAVYRIYCGWYAEGVSQKTY